MPVVVPLKDKPGLTIEEIKEATRCEHIAYEVTGVSNREERPGGFTVWERRKCADCGHRWTASIEPPDKEEPKATPSPAVYGGGRVVTYVTEHGQYELVVDEIAMVSLQNGVLMVQNPQVPVRGIVGVRPWLREEHGHAADTEG